MSTPKKLLEPLLVRVFIPEINAQVWQNSLIYMYVNYILQKCVVVNPNDTVKAAQSITLEKIAKVI